MSLIKQLWIGTVVLLFIALAGSFLISAVTARNYLEQQLQLKNIDTSTAVALSLTQMDKDPITVELLIAALFDTGHYRSILLEDPLGDVIVNLTFDETKEESIPEWFTAILSIDISPGVAQIQDGWQQYGTLYIQSHTIFAYEALWDSIVKLFVWLLVAAVACGLVGTSILKVIIRPLGNVIVQAESISQQQFVISKEPKTKEFRLLVEAMNRLSTSVKKMLEKKTRELELLRQESQQDTVTKLPNRRHFLNMLDSSLTQEDSPSIGCLCIIRVLNLGIINGRHGHQTTDLILKNIGETLSRAADNHKESYAGRLNGADFALVSYSYKTLTDIANQLSSSLFGNLERFSNQEIALELPIAACCFQVGEQRSVILALLDGAITMAESKGNSAVIILEEHAPFKSQNTEEWRTAITTALETEEITLGSFPVRLLNGDSLHLEMPVRMKFDKEWRPAGYFIGWADKLDLLDEIDLQVLKLALLKIEASHEQVAINLSEDALCSDHFRTQAIQLLERDSEHTAHLWIEFPEAAAIKNPGLFPQFCNQLKSLGCRVGLEHVGSEFTKILDLQGLGLHYLKVDSSVIRDIHMDETNHAFLKGLCNIGHSLGITMIAEGVMNNQQKSVLESLNLDAVTGPGVD